MASTNDSSEQLNHLDDQEQHPIDESEEIDQTTANGDDENNNNNDTSTTNNNDELIETDMVSSPVSMLNPANMITAEASFSEATSADIPVGATRSSVARILVKPGQIFRVQVDNEVKEVHGKTV